MPQLLHGPVSGRERAGHLTWGAWLVSVIASFAALETAAYAGRFPTLSRTLCHWLGLDPRRRSGPVALLGFAGIWAWLVVHLHLTARRGEIRWPTA
jgi:hypothetical protein